ncbi:MAG TPA: hypothetical protein VJS65_04320 [Verrucomicrobiae bacterium]|nr:hypothetical protein [Verrucomicrobiae bacterium]
MDRIRVAWWARGAAALLNPANHLPQGFDFPFVAGLLPIGFLEQFEKQLHLIQGVAQVVDDVLDILDRLLQRPGFRRPERRSMDTCRLWHWPRGPGGRSLWRFVFVLNRCVGILLVQIFGGFRSFRRLGVCGEDGFVVAAKSLRFRNVRCRCGVIRAVGYGFLRGRVGGERFLGRFGFIRRGSSRCACWRSGRLVAGSTADGATGPATCARPAWLG